MYHGTQQHVCLYSAIDVDKLGLDQNVFRFYENENDATRQWKFFWCLLSSIMMPLRLASNSKSNITIQDCDSIETHHRTQRHDPMHHGTQQHFFLYSAIDVVTN